MNGISSTASKTCLAKNYPALDIAGGGTDLMLAALDDFSPTAIEERADAVRAFFPTSAARDAAGAALAVQFAVNALEVSDEDWARRSQENLPPVTIGRITILSNPDDRLPTPEPRLPNSDSRVLIPESRLAIAIRPSMGFGTGHHATTRLCLEALQGLDVAGKRVLDIGTGSGVLAIAARLLGAEAVGIDVDADAIQSARENLSLNPDATHVRFEVVDLAAVALPPADIVLANLTGALLVRAAATLWGSVVPDGVLIVSGLQSHERDDVLRALAPKKILWQREEDSWVGLALHL
jgi:ribosomal protein L11 methyltransferase